MTFSNYFSFEQYQSLVNIYNKTKNDDKSVYQELEQKTFGKALIGFLEHLNSQNKLAPVNRGEGHITNFQNSYNKLLNKEQLEKYDEVMITRMLSKVIFFSIYFRDNEVCNEEAMQERYNKLNTSMTSGSFESHYIGDGNCYCFECGEDFKLHIDNWQMKFTGFELVNNRYQSVEPQSCIAKGIVEQKITFEKGNLLIADWFRIDEFTQAVEGADEFDVNSAKGRLDSTEYYAKHFNFINVSVGNTCPTIFKDQNNLIFGRQDYDAEESQHPYKEKGSVCTDLWAVTIIEKHQLIKIIADHLAKNGATDATKQAKELVSDYLKEEDVTKFKVEPGTYTLRFNGSYEQFINHEDKTQFPPEIQPFFTLKQSEPILVKKMKM